MKNETEEVQEIEILTEEQMALLPKEVVNEVVVLNETVGPKDLVQLNPLVTKLLDLSESSAKLKIKPADKEGNFDKENIQSFIDVQKEIKSYRASVKETAKVLKKPYQDINKSYISIEKSFVGLATNIFEDNEKKFEAYRKEQKRIAEEKQKAKDKAIQDKIDEANKEAEQAKNQVEISSTYNFIKYEIIAEKITKLASQNILNANEKALKVFLSDLKTATYDEMLLTSGKDDSILEESVREELKNDFETSKAQAIQIVEEKLDAIYLEIKEKASNFQEQEVIKKTPTVPVPPVPTSKTDVEEKAEELIKKVTSMSDAEFINYINSRGKVLYALSVDRVKKNPKSSPEVYDLRSKLLIFN